MVEFPTMSKNLFDYSWFSNFNTSLANLSNIAMPENWNYKNTPFTGHDYPILSNYLQHTFARVSVENKIVETESGSHSCFNTGLCTPNHEDIFALFEKNKKPGSRQKWFFIKFEKRSAWDLSKFGKLPEAAHYFHEPQELIFDTRLELRINYDHIIQDNQDRFPTAIKNGGSHIQRVTLEGSVHDAISRTRRNYKTAIPQFYNEKLQLLLPLCLQTKSQADLALVVQKQASNFYMASTILTLDMAYNNARLIAKPDEEWLKP